MEKNKNIGIKVEVPKTVCNDRHCPFHGDLKVRGRIFVGEIKKTDTSKTATFFFERMHYLNKYERYERRMTKMRVHNPSCINAKAGDKVKIAECKPISKTKKFVIVEVLK
jgi:small subunit ribosomal protein S17